MISSYISKIIRRLRCQEEDNDVSCRMYFYYRSIPDSTTVFLVSKNELNHHYQILNFPQIQHPIH